MYTKKINVIYLGKCREKLCLNFNIRLYVNVHDLIVLLINNEK